MPATISAKQHTCGTCKYWRGKRERIKNPSLVEVEFFVKGMCAGPSRVYHGKITEPIQYGASCWEIMPGLKEYWP